VVLILCLENKTLCIDFVFPLGVEEKVQPLGKRVGSCSLGRKVWKPSSWARGLRPV